MSLLRNVLYTGTRVPLQHETKKAKVSNTVPMITDVSVCILDLSSEGHPLSGDPEKKNGVSIQIVSIQIVIIFNV